MLSILIALNKAYFLPKQTHSWPVFLLESALISSVRTLPGVYPSTVPVTRSALRHPTFIRRSFTYLFIMYVRITNIRRLFHLVQFFFSSHALAVFLVFVLIIESNSS